MEDLFSPFRQWRQARWIIIVALLYGALLLPFKPLVVVPGFTEVRPANFIPPLAGVLLGPAAAWGSAFGNLIADLFGGTFSAGSLFGFIGNFLFAWAPWKVWEFTREKGEEKKPDLHLLGVFVIASLAGSAVCGLVIGIGLGVLGLQMPTQALFMSMFITLNNFMASLVLGSIGLWLLYGKLKV
ncbi:QueT transporter [uncultured archaeon]|nr:QueT transporter [uncultured archaeon]